MKTRARTLFLASGQLRSTIRTFSRIQTLWIKAETLQEWRRYCSTVRGQSAPVHQFLGHVETTWYCGFEPCLCTGGFKWYKVWLRGILKRGKGSSTKWPVPCSAHSNGVSLLQSQWPRILWFSALNNALNRISLDTLWFISACMPTHIDAFSSQGSAVLKQGKHLLPSGRRSYHTMSWETVVG